MNNGCSFGILRQTLVGNIIEIANVVVELPSIEEQGKIIAAIQGYTTKLDIEEALLERILDLKQYLLRQMFI